MENAWKPAESIDAVRDELRRAIFSTHFHMGLAEINNDKQRLEMSRQRASSFAEFGVNSGLFEPSEANEWFDATWGRKTPASVAIKYMKQPTEAER